MQRSSASIASLAAALAKAQARLVNPEKSRVATIRSNGPGGPEQSFRYAPLSSGLDIVRKTLGQHEIATVQTTAIDQGAGIVNLTTVLAHSSGEWIASDWPVCAISETVTPHRMGAALTYARRYALFTLVGIAGEDDIDAPDLAAPRRGGSEAAKPRPNPNPKLNDGYSESGVPILSRKGIIAKAGTSILDSEASAALRDQLAAELQAIVTADDATAWAHRSLGAKSRLVAADARQLEEAFADKLALLGPTTAAADEDRAASADRWAPETPEIPSRGSEVDKSQLVHPEPRRVRDKEHVRFVAKQPCLVCGRRPVDPHHLRFAQSRALGRKVSDEFTIPLCRGHHRELHRCGDEAGWWRRIGIEPAAAARVLWLKTHPLPAERAQITAAGAAPVDAATREEPDHLKRDRAMGRQGTKCKTKPNAAVQSQ